MPKVKDKSRVCRRGGASDDDDEMMATQQSTSTQADRSLAQLSRDERASIVNNIVRYLVIADNKKLPIKRADIVKHTMKDHGRAFNPLMKEACDKLRDVFGIDAVFDEKLKGYIMINTIDNVYDDPHQVCSNEDNSQQGLVMVILAVIFMKGNVIDEETLWDMLKRLGVRIDGTDDTFGDVRHLVNLLVRQGYFELEREPGDPPRTSYRWGPRARRETAKQQVLDFVCQVYDTPQQRWVAQMRDIEQSESAGNNANADD